jgi:HD-GYP domain-containing protein (c-di-GMP phosphodiesterase class II)
MNKKPVPVGALQFGMYIAELDRPWTETPFMFQGFYLRTEQQLQALREFCKHVFVDMAWSGAPALVAAAATQPARSHAPGFAIQGDAEYSAESELEREIRVAGALYSQTFAALARLVEPLEKGGTALDGQEVQRLVRGLAESIVRNPDALLLLSKMRETKLPAHARALQVSVYMMVFGRFLQREREDIVLLGLMGLLQDIGKSRLPSALFETRGPLTREASELRKKHVELSAHILGITSGLPPKLPAMVLLHHERQDGKGYPRGLRGYQIGLHGAVAAICDAYDALLAPPPYGEGQSPSAAVNLLVKDRGAAFHGPLLEKFIRCMGAFAVGSAVELNSGDVGIVIGANLTQRLKPKVLLLHDRAGKPVPSGRIVDLAVDTEMRIRGSLDQGKLGFDPRRLF